MNPYLNFSLEGKVALVTGASYGIGFAIASALAISVTLSGLLFSFNAFHINKFN